MEAAIERGSRAADRRGLAGRVEPVASGDFLDEMIGERTRANPEFPRLLDAASGRRQVEADRATASELGDGGPDPK